MCYNKDTKKEKQKNEGENKTFTFTIEHKHCGMITTIEGYDIYSAMRNNNKNINLWIVKEIEKN